VRACQGIGNRDWVEDKHAASSPDGAVLEAQRMLADDHDVAADVSIPTSFQLLRDDALGRHFETDAPAVTGPVSDGLA
jgi:hypothetical protein